MDKFIPKVLKVIPPVMILPIKGMITYSTVLQKNHFWLQMADILDKTC